MYKIPFFCQSLLLALLIAVPLRGHVQPRPPRPEPVREAGGRPPAARQPPWEAGRPVGGLDGGGLQRRPSWILRLVAQRQTYLKSYPSRCHRHKIFQWFQAMLTYRRGKLVSIQTGGCVYTRFQEEIKGFNLTGTKNFGNRISRNDFTNEFCSCLLYTSDAADE